MRLPPRSKTRIFILPLGMPKKLSFFLLVLLSSWSCGQKNTHSMPDHTYTNELINESSPYLLEHAHNPVQWYPWGEKALEKAKKEDKPLIISIGYAACHWCHVMERESFSDTSIAQIMNENFVCIKVDREERPDVDQIYMDACQLVTGSGGWPLNAFALPDGRPFYAGTYFPPAQWAQLLKQLDQAYKGQYEKVLEQANNITLGIKQMDLMDLETGTKEFEKKDYEDLFKYFKDRIDPSLGGFKGAPKFPLPVAWEFLLEFHKLTGNEESAKATNFTLEKMGFGGLNDQLAGGFARYSTDDIWRVPHFEKMLYDNAQLISLYSHSYQNQKDEYFSSVIKNTIEFVERELQDHNGGFYSSLNADSEGEEGKFYVWTWEELSKVLNPEELKLVSSIYGITEKGNWEKGTNIFYLDQRPEVSSKEFGQEKGEFDKRLNLIKEKLMAERSKRIRPSTDDKILCSWNAMMATSYLDAYQALDETKYLEKAKTTADFLWDKLYQPNTGLYRNFKNNKASITGFLDDYAFMIQLFIDLYQSDFDISWLEKAEGLMAICIKDFSDESNTYFYFTSKEGEKLIARKMELADNVIPSSNSVMAVNLFKLGHLVANDSYLERSTRMLKGQLQNINKGGPYYSNWARLMGYHVYPFYEVAIAGENAISVNRDLRKNFIPNAVFLGGNSEDLELLKGKLIDGQTTIYVCKNRVCDLPVTKSKQALELLQK